MLAAHARWSSAYPAVAALSASGAWSAEQYWLSRRFSIALCLASPPRLISPVTEWQRIARPPYPDWLPPGASPLTFKAAPEPLSHCDLGLAYHGDCDSIRAQGLAAGAANATIKGEHTT